tara:strand:+ start:307 stop:1437 length:1131 start_codon:yes stop_codon:yes gene_type:complete
MTLCMAPWNHIQINAEGVINPCCQFWPSNYHKKYDNLQEAFDGEENAELRQRMLNGETIEGCHKCDLYASLNKYSYREHFSLNYKRNTLKNPKIRELEFAIDNTCNFKCVSCNSRFSSLWYNDDLKLRELGFKRNSIAIDKKQKIIRNANNLDSLDLSELNYLKLIGGEPFVNDRYIDILKTLNLENLTLALMTNNSVFPEKWIEYIIKVKDLSLHISLDGIGEVGEFVRNGLNFEKFNNNLLRWIELKKEYKQIDIKFNFVVHSLNILNLKATLEYLKSVGFESEVKHIKEQKIEIDFLEEPIYLNLKYLPDKLKDIIEERMDFNLNGKRDMIVEFMRSDKHDPEIMNQFLKFCMFLEEQNELPSECEFILNHAI